MGDYVFLCIVLFSMVLASKTWPREDSFNQPSKDPYNQRAVDVSKRQVDSHKREVASARRERPPEGPIVFPGKTSSEDRDSYSAEGKGINCIANVCENATDYPYDHIKKVVGSISQYRNLFGHSEGTYVDQPNRVTDGEPEAKPLCEATTYTKFPQTLKTEKNVTKYIVNDGDFKQGLIFETCVNEAAPKDASFPEGYEAKCVQKYATRRLLSIEADQTGEPAFDSFVVPACCVCTYKRKKN